ncbi:TetR/AcrR family transcriptional regulator [Streptosporangium roseum]|uniref:Transcriptional regulator, TetR family n=1 Tax=Streptosporangium roseum (strain ATCC 12428 / DSM 43021 / JCM 3005 / KCTC 9067 / NCIMB 10171 / NRRL 2505 / NI 9100) TaxID=479432 RepID=D2B951_STRRD|nr:TetR/AcrR family transcriptional regulator [Streptosporangium roseum]ACZ91596.1 putative transcriptional regulator, TetR family [Streptosporangium roseum DSM 43021]
MRADARRNRELIVTTALDLFTESGAGVSMEEIARAAGLGVGTLYRHFPDRQALLEAIALDALGRLQTFTRAAVAEDTPRWQVLRRIVEQCVELPLALIKTLLAATPANPELREMEHDVNARLEHLLGQAQQEGTLRPDIPPREIVELLNVAVCRPGARVDDHLTTVILDGLKR